jgi:uncharacterized membrane protein YcaP (DUF421 family)
MIWEQIQALLGLGLDVGDVGSLQMALRTILIYAFTLTLVRLGSKRFLAEATAFDVIVGIMLGSIMSRAINGSAPFVPTLFGGAVLVGVHWLLGVLSYHLDWFGPLVKGSPVLLIKDGEIQRPGVRQAGLSNQDLEQALRLQANQADLSKVRLAYMERNGNISMIPSRSEPRVFTVQVEEGVQTVRIELAE